jgi:hypothetical protein
VGIEDRIKRLEASAGQARQESEDDARRRRVFDRLYFEVENGRRALQGLDPLPTPPGLEDTRDDILHTLRTTIPHYRADRGWKHGEGREFLDRWQDELLEKLNELDKGDEQ